MTALIGLEAKGALVLGGGQGMGEATALQLAQAKCRVAVLDLDLGRAQAVVSKIKAEGGEAIAIASDALDDAKFKAALLEADEAIGGVDVLASIIGMAGWSPIVEMTEDVWDLDHRRNLRYFFIAAKTIANQMMHRQRSGAMVCISSVDGIRSSPYHASYGAAKAGLMNLVKSMAIEWAEHGIRVNAVAPGSIVTPRVPLRTGDAELEMSAGIPLKKRGAVEDIAKAALFFLSDMSRYVTGQTLAVDGGLVNRACFDYQMRLSEAGGGGTLGTGTSDGMGSPLQHTQSGL